MGNDNTQGVLSATTFTSEKKYEATHNDTTTGSGTLIHKLTCSVAHSLKTGESIRIIKDNGDLPEGLDPHTVYYAITSDKNSSRQDGIGLSQYEIQIASSKTNADRTTPVYIKSIGSPADGILNVIQDACRAIDLDGSLEKSLNDMKSKGVKILSTSDL